MHKANGQEGTQFQKLIEGQDMIRGELNKLKLDLEAKIDKAAELASDLKSALGGR
jgi:hypothetical protein